MAENKKYDFPTMKNTTTHNHTSIEGLLCYPENHPLAFFQSGEIEIKYMTQLKKKKF